MKLRTLSKSDIKNLNSELEAKYDTSFFTKKDKVQEMENEDKLLVIQVNDKPMFFQYENSWIPTIHTLLKNNFLKKITVDMGSIKFICNGADILRPGIVDISDNIKENQLISIIDEKNKVPIAIGSTIYNSEELKNMEKGKVIKNVHYIGDSIWNSTK